jgi:hypothetical protein
MAITLAGPHAAKVILFILGALTLGSIAWHLLKGQSHVRLGISNSEQGPRWHLRNLSRIRDRDSFMNRRSEPQCPSKRKAGH